MKYEYWYANITGISNREKIQLRSSIKSAEELYHIEETELAKRGIAKSLREAVQKSIKEWNLDSAFETFLKSNCRMITFTQKEYPSRLKTISAPPYALYVKGKLPPEQGLTIAIVGARECSCYGQEMANVFASELAQCGIPIISGMARGIDGISQKAALDAGGSSYAVLGCGVDVCYPKEYWNLYNQLQMQGGILSEQPPGMQPLARFFPARNRIISGLADVILVIEAKEKSGSLITADMALEQGKEVYALPGPVNSLLSRGCHNLIKQGAGILISPEDLLEELAIMHKIQSKKTEDLKILLESTENIVYSCLDFLPKNPGVIHSQTGMPIPVILDHLVSLVLKGYVKEVSKNYYVRIK